eukprot:g664.t1
MDSIEEEFALNYGYNDETEYEDSLEAEFALNYEACAHSTASDEVTSMSAQLKQSPLISETERRGERAVLANVDANCIDASRESATSILNDSISRVLKRKESVAYKIADGSKHDENDEDPLLAALRGGGTPGSVTRSRNRRRLSSISPGTTVLPHYELKDPLDGIFDDECATKLFDCNVTSPRTKSEDDSACGRIGLLSPSLTDDAAMSSCLTSNTNPKIFAPSTEVESRSDVVGRSGFEGMIVADFLSRANARHRCVLDSVVGSGDVFLASAMTFDLVCERMLHHALERLACSDHSVTRNDAACKWSSLVRLLDTFVDVEMCALLHCTNDAPATVEQMRGRRIRFRNFDLSTVCMPQEDNEDSIDGFGRLLLAMKHSIEVSRELPVRSGDAETATLTQCFLLSLREFERICTEIMRPKKASTGVGRSALKGMRKQAKTKEPTIDNLTRTFPKAAHLSSVTRGECRLAARFYADELSQWRDGGKATPPLQGLISRLLETQIRFALRRCLNCDDTVECGTTMTMVAHTGSLCFNDYDLAAVVNRALEIIHRHEMRRSCALASRAAMWGSCSATAPELSASSTNETNESESAKLERYLDACKFVVNLFSEPTLFEKVKLGQDGWDTLVAALRIAKDCGVDRSNELVKFSRFMDMDAFYAWLCAEKASVEAEIARLAPPSLSKRQKKKQRRKKRRRRRSLSGRRSKRSDERSSQWQFPRLKMTCNSQNYKKEWLCVVCEKVVMNYNEGGEIACDKCGRWSHLKCLGLPEDYAHTVSGYLCATCDELSE